MIAPSWALAAALALAPLTVVLQNRTMAPVALLGFAGVILLGWHRGWRPSAPPPLAWPMLALLGWAAISALWSPDAGRALEGVLRLGALLALALLAADVLRREPPSALLPRAAAIGLATGIAAALFDDLTGNALRASVRGLREWGEALSFGLKNAASIIALMLPLAAFARTLPQALRIGMALAGGIVVLLLPGESAKLAVLAGLGAGVAAAFAPRLTRHALGMVAVLAVLTLPWLLGAALPRNAAALPASAAHRLLIWDFTAERIAERPWLGWGMDASRAIPGGSGTPDAARQAGFGLTSEADAAWFTKAQLLPLHPHNLALQAWLELGVVGALLLAWLLAGLARAARSPAACGCLAAGLVIAMLSYGAWQYWWVAGLLLAAIAVAERPEGCGNHQHASMHAQPAEKP